MLDRILDRLEEWLIASLIAAATVITFVAVVHRYGASNSAVWKLRYGSVGRFSIAKLLTVVWTSAFCVCSTAAVPCTVTELSNVMAAKVYVVSRNLDETREYTDDKTYDLGQSGTVGPANDHFKRHVYSALISLPNRVGPREPILAS